MSPIHRAARRRVEKHGADKDGAPRRRATQRQVRRWLPRAALRFALVTLTAGCHSTTVPQLRLAIR